MVARLFDLNCEVAEEVEEEEEALTVRKPCLALFDLDECDD